MSHPWLPSIQISSVLQKQDIDSKYLSDTTTLISVVLFTRIPDLLHTTLLILRMQRCGKPKRKSIWL